MNNTPDESSASTGGNHTSPAMGPTRGGWALNVLVVLALLYTLYFASSILIPVTLALLLNLVLSPLVNSLSRSYLPRGLAAGMVLAALIAVLISAFYTLAAPASEWLAATPGRFAEMEGKMRFFTEPWMRIKEVTQNLEAMANPDSFRDELEVKVQSPGVLQAVATGVPALVTGMVISGVLLYFLLAGGDSALRKLVQLVPGLTNKRRMVETIHVMRREIAVYLATITLINIGLGCTVTLVLWLLGMPNPLLWGVLSGVLNYMPYIGAVISVSLVAVAAIMSFDTVSYALLIPAAVFLLSSIEGQLITPAVAGRNLSLSPVAAFLMMVGMSWIWGAMGALMAIPLLASIKIACERIDGLRPISLMLMHPRSSLIETATLPPDNPPG